MRPRAPTRSSGSRPRPHSSPRAAASGTTARLRPEHRMPWTRETAAERQRLWAECERLSAVVDRTPPQPHRLIPQPTRRSQCSRHGNQPLHRLVSPLTRRPNSGAISPISARSPSGIPASTRWLVSGEPGRTGTRYELELGLLGRTLTLPYVTVASKAPTSVAFAAETTASSPRRGPDRPIAAEGAPSPGMPSCD